MTFKVIIKCPNVEDDEHTYYGMVFLKDGKNQLKELQYNQAEDNLQESFVFDGHPVQSNENYLAVLFAVNESETIENPEYKIQYNSPNPEPEIVNF